MIGYQSAPVSARDGLLIDDSVVIEAGAIVEARSVGEGCVIDVNARVGKGAVLGKVSRRVKQANGMILILLNSIVKSEQYVRLEKEKHYLILQ
jgi:tetrahydrodipicolinate N-succinyltransferase